MESLRITVNEVPHECGHPITQIPYALSETEQKQEELFSRLKLLDLSVEEIDTWHRMTNPLKEYARHGLHALTDRIDGLESSAAILIANVQVHGQEVSGQEVNDLLITNGTLMRNCKSVIDTERVRYSIETDGLGLVHDNLNELDKGVVHRNKLELLFRAGELMLDASLVPVTRPNLRSPDVILNFIEGNPTDSNALSRLAAYRIFNMVFSSVDSLPNATGDEYLLKVQSIQHLISMQIADFDVFEHTIRTNLPELAATIDNPGADISHDTVNYELQLAKSRLSNTGFPSIDRLVFEPWRLKDLKKDSLLKALEVTEQIFGDKNQAAAHLSKSTYKGMAHEAIWLIDALMVNAVYGDGQYMFMKSMTRQDRNLEVTRPAVKKTFDITVRSWTEAPINFQLKSSKAGLDRCGTYDDSIALVHEKNFYDHGAARLSNKFNAYRAILEGKTSRLDTAKLLGKYALPSVQENVLPLVRTKLQEEVQ